MRKQKKRIRRESLSLHRGGYRILAVTLASALTVGVSACGKPSQENILPADATSIQEEESGVAVTISKASAKDALKKEETVSVKADAQGKPQKTTVDTTLEAPKDASAIIDVTDLTDIKNTDGDEEFELEPDGTLYWENRGESISYEGTSTKKLPVSVKVTYFLDGVQTSPSAIAGKTGQVTIRFEYENDTDVPFLMLSMAVLPKEHFTNIEVTKGKVLSFGDETIAIGYALPGVADTLKLSDYEPTEELEIPDSVEITANATDFELEFTETIVSTGLFADMDTEKLEDADDLIEAMDEFEEGSGKLVDGMAKMLDGSNEFGDYLSQYTDGAATLSENMGQLSAGLDAIDARTSDLVSGSKAVADGIAMLEEQISGMEEELTAMIEQQAAAAKALEQGKKELEGAAAQIQKQSDDLIQKSGEVDQKAAEYDKKAQTYNQKATEYNEKSSALSEKAEEVNQTIGKIDEASGVLSSKTDEINQKIEEINRAADEINSQKEEGAAAIAHLSPIDVAKISQISAVEYNAGELEQIDESAVGAGNAGVGSAVMTGGTAPAGVSDSTDGTESSGTAGTDASSGSDATSGTESPASSQGDGSIDSQIAAYTAQIAALKAALAQLKEGSAAVNAGITAYGGGVHKATLGADALAQGQNTLSESGAALTEGYSALIEGMKKLDDGIIEFDKEGVQNISKLAGDDLAGVIEGLRKLKQTDQEYTSFSGIRDGVEGSVRFMIETAEIKAE